MRLPTIRLVMNKRDIGMQLSAVSKRLLASGLVILGSMSGAFANPAAIARPFQHLGGSQLVSREATLAPMAHVMFCKSNPTDCRATHEGLAVVLDENTFAKLDKVNRQVNASIRPRADRGRGPLKDVWSIAPREGDCEDYALTKRHMLLKAGWPSSALLIAVARTAEGEGHAVLVVRTSVGDVVLDNLNARIRSSSDSGLHWVKMQSPSDPRRWMAL